MTFDLLNRRLTDVDNRQTLTMPPKDFLRKTAGRPWREIPLCHHRLSPRWSAVRSTGCGSGASPFGRACARGRTAVPPAVSPRPDKATPRSLRDPSQRTTAHSAWRPSLGDSSNPVKLSAVSCMVYRATVSRRQRIYSSVWDCRPRASASRCDATACCYSALSPPRC